MEMIISPHESSSSVMHYRLQRLSPLAPLLWASGNVRSQCLSPPDNPPHPPHPPPGRIGSRLRVLPELQQLSQSMAKTSRATYLAAFCRKAENTKKKAKKYLDAEKVAEVCLSSVLCL